MKDQLLAKLPQYLRSQHRSKCFGLIFSRLYIKLVIPVRKIIIIIDKKMFISCLFSHFKIIIFRKIFTLAAVKSISQTFEKSSTIGSGCLKDSTFGGASRSSLTGSRSNLEVSWVLMVSTEGKNKARSGVTTKYGISLN